MWTACCFSQPSMRLVVRARGASVFGSARGFTLIEAIIATTLMAMALVLAGRLLTMSKRANQSATAIGIAAVLAEQKMEQLRGLTWGLDAGGLPLTDTTSDV